MTVMLVIGSGYDIDTNSNGCAPCPQALLIFISVSVVVILGNMNFSHHKNCTKKLSGGCLLSERWKMIDKQTKQNDSDYFVVECH